MEKIYPEKLKAGGEVRIIAPSRSLAIVSEEALEVLNKDAWLLGAELNV